MKHQLTNQVKLLQKLALWVGDEVLVLKRSPQSKTRANQWDLPGGNSEWPKNTLAIAKDPHLGDLLREVAEETGIKLDPTRISRTPTYFGTYFEANKQVFTIIVGWQASLPAKPSIIISSEHIDFTWISLDQFDNYDFGFAGNQSGFIRNTVFFHNK